MIKLFYTFLLLLISTQIFFSQEKIYPLDFYLEATVSGKVIGDGKVFKDNNNVIISFYSSDRRKKDTSKIIFYNKFYKKVKELKFKPDYVLEEKGVLIYDFDNDGFDELVFATYNNSSIIFNYLNPSASDSLIKLFEIQSKAKPVIKISHVRLDTSNHQAIFITTTPFSLKNFSNSGIWLYSLKEMRVLWKKLTAHYASKSNAISYLDKNNKPFIYYSTYSANRGLFFSNKNYFIKNKVTGSFISWDENLNLTLNKYIDTTANDYSCDSVSYIKKLNSFGEEVWTKEIRKKYFMTKLFKIKKNDSTKILLIGYKRLYKKERKVILEIINPITNKTEKNLEIKNYLRFYYIGNNRIFLSFYNNQNLIYDYDLNLLVSKKSDITYTPKALINFDNSQLFLCRQNSGEIRRMFLLDTNLEKKASKNIFGFITYLKKDHLISVFSTINDKSKIYSIIHVPWYKQITPSILRNIIIAILFTLLSIMLLWINSLRVASKKIMQQKKEIENTNAELHKTTSKLIRAEKLAVYGTIASGIAHEINSPLGAIINSAQRIKKNPNADLEQNIDLIEKAGKRSKAIIEKLLVNTRKSDGTAKTSLTTVLEDWKELSYKQFEYLGIKFITDITCNHLLAISSTELNQILTNLFFNARDAIMESKNNKKEITITSKKIENSYCQIIIRDSGNGFSKEKLENPFEAFETTKEQGKGTGLGLWIVKNIIDNIGGKISLNNVESGAEIIILIPLFKEKET